MVKSQKAKNKVSFIFIAAPPQKEYIKVYAQ